MRVVFVPFTGLRVGEQALAELGMSLPGLRRRAGALSELPALGVLTLAGLTPPPWETGYVEGSDDPQVIEQVADQQPTLVAVSALTASIRQAYRFCEALQRRGIPTVIGGLHVTVCPDEAAAHCSAVVVGEGEPVWEQVLQDAEAGALRPRYAAEAPFDLRRSPLPRFDLLGPRPRPRMTLQTERGCPYACEFCGASRLLGPFRLKPIESVRRELQHLRRNGRPLWLELADDNTFASGDRSDLLETLAQSGARYFTEADWRIGEQPQMLRRLADSGCVQALVGIESLVFRYGGMGAKDSSVERMMDAVRAIQDAGVVVNGCFIVGADGETAESLERLGDFILDSPLAELQLTVQTPFPGTALHGRLQRQGRLLSDRDWPHYTLFDVTFQPDSMTVAELESGFRRLVQRVFSPQAAARRGRLRRQIWAANPTFRCRSQE